jgi:glycosyltransferase involved in cell wall biosynthesis
MPDPTRDSGSVRLREILLLLRELGWSVVFAPDSGRATASEHKALLDEGIEVIGVAGTPSLPSWLHQHGSGLSAAMLCRHEVAAIHLDLVRAAAPRARILFDTVDLHSLREERTALIDGNRALLRTARRSGLAERSLAARSDVTFVVSPIEQALLQAELPGARIELLSNIHSVAGTDSPFEGRSGALFVGGFAHPPNRDAAHWLVERILPLLQRELPGMPLHLVGSIPGHERKLLQREHVHIHGQVAELGPWMDRCLVAVAPLRSGAGVKGKVNSAMSHGLPVVATRVAAEGMQLEDGHDVLLADSAEEFSACIARLSRDHVLWKRLSTNGQENIRRHFSRDRARETLLAVLGPRAADDALR